MTSNQEIGQRIKSRRLELGLTMQSLADKAGVNKSTIKRYEDGSIQRIKLPVIYTVASALDVNPSWLIFKSEEKNKPVISDDDELVRKGMDMLKGLTEEKKLQVLEYIHFLAEHQDKKR